MSEGSLRRPRVALTLALAGKRTIAADARAGLEVGLALAFRAIGERLESLHAEAARGEGSLVLRFCTEQAARLTLITGLADGADQIGCRIFAAPDPEAPTLEKVLGAVLPCARSDFVANSKVEDDAAFDRLALACAFIVELDGCMPPGPNPGDGRADSKRARQSRADAFEGQSEFLLRQADMLIAVDSPDEAGRDGGTRQTVRSALDLGMPVVLLHVGHEGIAVLRARADLDEPVLLPQRAAAAAIAGLVDSTVGVRDSAQDAGYVDGLLEEYFADHVPGQSLRTRIWDWFEARFAPSGATPPSPDSAPYRDYRQRARALSAFYAGQYRGSFLLTYALAVVAVALALMSQALLLTSPAGEGPASPSWWELVMLGLAKLAVLIAIARLVTSANHRRLAHRAADFRYLSERLRTMMYLPRAGSLRPPSPWSLPYTTRVATQGVMDRLFTSILRQVEPVEALAPETSESVVRQDARAAVLAIRDGWLASQVHYHRRNHQKLLAMSRWLERSGRWLNRAVIGVVLLDVATLMLGGFGVLNPRQEAPVRLYVGPALIFLAAILPAAVASLNGVRFQSECARLADRSAQMSVHLATVQDRANMPRPRPARMLDALRLAEDVARLTLDEVAEWSAIYGKEFVEM
jgi:hypothetical protein